MANNQKDKLKSWFENLHENKIIYYKQDTILATLSDFKYSLYHFSATLTYINPNIYKDNQRLIKGQNTSWNLTLDWSKIKIEDKHQKIHLPDVNITIYTEPSFVKYIEKLVEYGDIDDALKLIH